MNNFKTQRKTVSIDEVYPNKWNPNVQDEKTFQREIESIKIHGFIDPILVRKKGDVYEIIDGEHRWRAARELKYTEIIIESLGEVDDTTAKILCIKMNNLRGQDDVLKRAEILKTLKEGQLSLLPFDKSQIENELKLLDFDFDQFNNVNIPNEEKAKIPLKEMLNLVKRLVEIKLKFKNKKVRLLIEQFIEIVKAFEKLKVNE